MAEGSEDIAQQVGGTHLERRCDPCNEYEGIQLQAAGYCVDCNDFLCESCFNYHLKVRTCRDHVLQDSNTMPTERMNSKDARLSRSKYTKCNVHQTFDFGYYCRGHKQLCCEKCLTLHHALCSDLKTIQEAINEENGEAGKFENRLQEVNRKYGLTKQSAEANLKIVDDMYDTAIRDLEAKLKKIKTKDHKKIKTVKDSCGAVQTEICCWLAETQALNNDRESFIFRKLTEKQLEATEESYYKLTESNAVVQYKFVESYPLDDKCIGSVQVVPVLVQQVSVTSNKQESCAINDMLVLDNGFLLATDATNNAVKMVDISKNRVIDSVQYNNFPHTMTLVKDNVVTVTQPYGIEKQLLQVKVSEAKLACMRNFSKFEGQYQVIRRYGDKLLAQYTDPIKLRELNSDGSVVRTICDNMQNGFMQKPVYGDVCQASGSLFLTCYQTNSISKISMEGEVTCVLRSDKLNEPRGIILHPNNGLLVCCTESKSVVLVDFDGSMHEYISDLPFRPKSLAYDDIKEKLFVAGYHENVFVYQYK